MKIYILFIAIIVCFNSYAQVNLRQYDYILNDSISITSKNAKTDILEHYLLDELKTESSIQKRLGKEYKKDKYVIDINNEYWERYSFKGVEIKIAEGLNGPYVIHFNITSPKYNLHFQDGKYVHVGMKSKDLQNLSPKSYQKIIEGKLSHTKGNYVMYVVYASYINGELIFWDKWLEILVDMKNNNVSEIYTFNPM